MEWYVAVLKKYAEFSGRARRKEFWMFTLFNGLIGLGLTFFTFAVLGPLLGTVGGTLGIIISTVYWVALFVPNIAVTVRRLHDTNRSGAWFFISFVPLIGSIWLLVLLVLDSDAEENQYGLNPKLETV